MNTNGCLVNNNVYPNPTGIFFNNSNVEYYYNNNPIHVQYYSQDPVCGLPQNDMVNQGKQCIVGSNWGSVVKYKTQDVNCPLNVPLDNSSIMFLLFFAVIYIALKAVTVIKT